MSTVQWSNFGLLKINVNLLKKKNKDGKNRCRWMNT